MWNEQLDTKKHRQLSLNTWTAETFRLADLAFNGRFEIKIQDLMYKWKVLLSLLSIGDQNFIKQLVHYDKDNMTDRILKKIGTYCSQADFQPEIIGRVSLAAKSLCMWVRAMEVYGRIYRVVEPKKQRLAQATAQLQEKQAVLAEAKAKLKEVRW